MRAILIEKYGRPEVLTERTLPDPEPGREELLIETEYAGVNFADLLQRLGRYGSAPDLPYVPGFEISGRVIRAGPDVSGFSEGDPVVAMTRFGGYSEQVCVTASQTRKIPEGGDLRRLAAVPVNYLTAYFCLFEMGHLKPGETVLIQGGAGGVGTAAVQLALLKKATVFATAGSEEKVRFLRKLGANLPINYRRQDFSAAVRERRRGQGVDLVLDAVGGKTLRQGYELLEPLGRLVCYGLSAAAPSERRSWWSSLLALWRTPVFKPLQLIGRNVGVFGFHLGLLGSREEEVNAALDQLLEWVSQEAIRPVIDRTFPLTREGAVEAHRYLHQRRNIGKVLLARQS